MSCLIIETQREVGSAGSWQYTADDYLTLLKKHGVQVSRSNKGDPYDNAMMESFFSTLRAELTDLEQFATRQANGSIRV